MDDLLRSWDGEEIVVRHDRLTGSWIVIAIHSTRLGPAGGGTRMKPYPSLDDAVADALLLAAGMTLKTAVAGLPIGGGKAVIAVPPDLDPEARGGVLRRYGGLVRQLGGLFRTGPDVGTSPADMDIVAETGAPYVFARTKAAGGSGGSAQPTALGVFSAIEAACERLVGAASPSGLRVLVQGAGGVGGSLIERLIAAGAEVLFSDINPAAIARFRDELGLTFVPSEAVAETECDIYAPCALGGVLNAESIPRLRCRSVVGAANNQLATPEDADRLRARNILYIPDFVANAGGAIAIIGMEQLGWLQAETEARVRGIKHIAAEVLETAEREGITSEAAGRCLAEKRLESAPAFNSAQSGDHARARVAA